MANKNNSENNKLLELMALDPKNRALMEAQEIRRQGGNYTTTTIATRMADDHDESGRITKEVTKNPKDIKYFPEKNKSEAPKIKATRLVKRQSANDKLQTKYGRNYSPEAVRVKQRKLIEAGYDIGKTGVDGDWGVNSQKAWKQYQADLKAKQEKKAKQDYTLNLKKNMKFTPSAEISEDLPVEPSAVFDKVKDDPKFQEWLYKSGGEQAPWYRKAANLFNVIGNYAYGMINPSGNTLLDLGEGTERQAVANALWNKSTTGTATINDNGHDALGGNPNLSNSGTEFRGDANEQGEKGLWASIGRQIKGAVQLPYHNIYGQSSDARFTNNGFVSKGDNYTFNNVWEDRKRSDGKLHIAQELNDGEGQVSLWEASKRGLQNLRGDGGIKTAMETAASVRGVNNTRHPDVTNISQEDLNKWAQEYIDYYK